MDDDRRVAVALAIGLGIGIAALMILLWTLGATVGTLGEWAGALIVAATLAASLWELAAARRRQQVLDGETAERRERELEERLVEADRKRRQQADRVSAWYAGKFEANHDRGWDHVIYVKNASDLPVFDIAIEVGEWSEQEAVNSTLVEDIEPIPLGPGEARAVTSGIVNDVNRAGEDIPPSVTMTFRDAAGTWWKRLPGGRLEEIPSRPHFWTDRLEGTRRARRR